MERRAKTKVNCLAVAAAVCLLAGCGAAYDPLTRQGLWVPTHINRDNLTLMVANPADLARGTGTDVADGQLAAVAVERLRTDKVKRLPAADIAAFSASNSGDNNTSSGAP